MPANEQTWRDTKLLHKIFGATSALMLLATIWMFAKDHSREWKPIQRIANRIEMTLTDWRRLQFESEDSIREHGVLAARLEEAYRRPVERSLLEKFEQQLHADPVTAEASLAHVYALADDLTAHAGEPAAEPLRESLVQALRAIIGEARYREDFILGERKFKSADRDAEVAALGILVRDSGNLPPDEALRLQQAKQQQVDQLKTELDELSASYDRAKDQRVRLEAIVKQITRETDEATEALAKNESDLKQLRESNVERRSTYVTWFGIVPLPGKKFLELPILDAFNSPRKIENLWSSGLEIDFSHRRVRRFDRCTTCHQLTQKTLPGSALDPAYEPEMVIDFRVDPTLASGESDASEADSAADSGESAGVAPSEDPRIAIQKELDRLIGVRVADEGLLSENDATIQFVRPESPASLARASSGGEAGAQPVSYAGGDLRLSLLQSRSPVTAGSLPPGLKVGDVIVAINGVPAIAPGKVASGLVDAAMSGRPFLVSVRRGMPNPYTTHPRLDLFVGSMSPHKATEFACTICHEGQGSATAFQWASHTPNTVRQREDWVFNRGWFDNPHWIFPMFPKRFSESACLKCHHEVVELEPSSKFPEPPAEKLVHGYHLITKYGCYGCHEINGYDGPRRIGPDLRLEPNYFAAALQIRNDEGYEKLTDEEKDWIAQIVDHPDRDAVRHRLLESLELDAESESPRLSAETNDKIVPLLRDVESPGQLRKAGPSLRYVGHKVDAAFLYDWIRDPRHFRPSTRMPKFFGLTRHLEGGPGLEASEQFEPIEILSAVTYLQSRTQPFEYLDPPAGVTEPADVARGKVQFQTRGCLACHTHKTFADANAYRPEDAIVQGPDLSGVGDKFRGEAGQRWLYSWIKEPTRYHPRTVMPDLFLDPISAGEGKLSDPAADIVAFLLEDSKTGWEPTVGTLTKPTEVNAEHLDRLLIENLAETFSHERAVAYAAKGIPSARRPDLKGAEVELLVDEAAQAEADFQLSAEQKLMYLGRRTLGKYGCYGCHDVPGFEDAKPIGTTLADWGRKDTARLAFEHINQYIEHAHAGEHAAHATTVADHAAAGAEGGAGDEQIAEGQTATADDHGEASEADREFYVEQLKSGHRAGFLYQKLLEPRSYDYHKTENKRYNERLRMPQFPFTVHDREAVVTFVLGLVADPPTDKYIYQPDETSQAVLAGRKVLEKYNCGGCHMLQPQKWQIAFQPDRFGEQAEVTTYPFVKSHFDPAALAASRVKDRSGLLRAELSGVPAVDDSAAPIAYDDAGDPLDDESDYRPNQLELPFELWQPSAVDGHGYDVGVLPINVLAENIERRYAADGGFLATYLLRHVVALEKQVNPAAKGTEAWGWLPPPLHGEGNKVQSEWLHNFLLDPHLIRPATFLRMPRFNMSPAEATALVAYFGAVDGAEFPYAYESRQQAGHLAARESEYKSTLGGAQSNGEARTRLGDAMRVVVNTNYCVKCHMVADFEPAGSERAKAPDLAAVYRRLRPEYVRKWIANPKTFLPYTSMPVNIPYDPAAPHLGGISQDLFQGTSVEQVDGLVDLLMNYDEFTRQRSSVVDIVKQYGGAAPPTEGQPAATEPAAANTAAPAPASAESAASGASVPPAPSSAPVAPQATPPKEGT